MDHQTKQFFLKMSDLQTQQIQILKRMDGMIRSIGQSSTPHHMREKITEDIELLNQEMDKLQHKLEVVSFQ